MAYHIRRRLTSAEQSAVGDAIDVRGTPEAQRRVHALPRRLLRAMPAHILAMEVGAV